MKPHAFGKQIFPLLAILLFFACTTSSSQTANNGLIPVTLQLKWFHQFQFAGYYAAIEQGYYREAGFDVTLVEGDPGEIPQTVAEVLSGRAQYGITNSDLLLERASGKPVVVLAAIFQHSPAALAVREDLNVSTPQQVSDLNLYLSQTPRTAELQAMLLNEGVALQRNNLMLPTHYPDYLFDDEADGFGVYMTNEPLLLAQTGRAFTYMDPKRYGIDFYGDVLYTSEAQIRENPEQVAQFIAASLRGWEYAMAHQEELVDLILAEYGSHKSREQLLFEAEAMEALILPDLVRIGHINPGRWQHIADIYTKLGFMPADFSLAGFVYDPASDQTPGRSGWAIGVLASLLVIALGAGGSVATFNRKLQGTVMQQTARLAQQNEDLTQMLATQQEAEHALRLSEAQFRAVWETAVDAMALSDANGILLAANPAYFSLYKRTPEETLNQSFSVIFAQADRAAADAQYKKIFRNAPDHPEPFEAEVYLGDGQTAWVESRIGFILENGQRVAILSLVRDITQRRLAENKMRELQEMLREAEGLARIGSWKYDLTTNTLIISNEIRQMFGENDWPQAVDGDLREVLANRVDAGDLAALKLVAQAAVAGEPSPAHEFQVCLPDGRLHDVIAKAHLMENGQVLFGYVQDITEQRQSEARQAELTAQLRQAQKMESVGRLAGGVAHDFNNQLAVIQLYSDLLLADEMATSQQRLRLDKIGQATQHATSLTRQLLAFSRQQVLHPVSLDLNHLIADLQKMLERIIGEDIILTTLLQPDLLAILADPVQIEQVIMNLIINARDAMPRGGRLTLQTENAMIDGQTAVVQLDVRPGQYVTLSLTDTGIGMDDATMKLIFEPFFTTKEVGKGTGLGLATVHGIVKQSNGAITVHSEPGVGTTFKIHLPTSDAPAENAADMAKPFDIPYGDETILLVEDEAFLRDMLQETLQEWGYTVLAAEDGRLAQKLALEYPGTVDLLLTDVVMPHLSGPELAQRLSAQFPDLKTIFMTGYAENNQVQQMINQGVQEFLKKPFSLNQLAAILSRALGEAAATP
ncbi:MAG: ABC transporter substrate-binding protein [Anaerolineaceae bacterium]|nr:ABC transporter substrate-binding protein [Anaerolineaceae bacterium]